MLYFYKLALLNKNCLFLLFFGKMQLTSCRTHTNISVYNALWLKVERGVFCISSKLFEVHTNARKKGNFQSCHKYLSSVTLLTKVQVNLFQKHLFLHQLTHNMTKDCSVHENSKLKTCCVQKLFCFDIQNNLCTQYVLNMFSACNFLVIQ